MGSWESPIIRVTTGKLNTVNDVYAGGPNSIGTRAKFGGQLGKALWLDADQVQLMYDPAVGTLYAGGYRYVKLSAASGAITRGQLLFWDNAAAVGAFQVTASATTTTDVTFTSLAGWALSVITPGNFGFIQFAGIVTARYVDNITAATTSSDTGNPVYVSTATAGRVDIFDNLTGTQVGDSVTNLPATWIHRFLGWQIDPAEDTVGGALGRIELARMMTTRL